MTPVDDLTEKRCAKCGTDRELTRPISLELNGEFFGRILCEDCHETEQFWFNCILCGAPRHHGRECA